MRGFVEKIHILCLGLGKILVYTHFYNEYSGNQPIQENMFNGLKLKFETRILLCNVCECMSVCTRALGRGDLR